MIMRIEIWQEKLVDNGKTLQDVIKGEYELHSSHEVEEHGWKDVTDYRKSCKKRHGYLGEVRPGVFKYELGTHFGVNSFHLISFNPTHPVTAKTLQNEIDRRVS